MIYRAYHLLFKAWLYMLLVRIVRKCFPKVSRNLGVCFPAFPKSFPKGIIELSVTYLNMSRTTHS